MSRTFQVWQDRTMTGARVRTYCEVAEPLEGAQLVCLLIDADTKNPFVTEDEYGLQTMIGGQWVECHDRDGFPINLAFPDWAWE